MGWIEPSDAPRLSPQAIPALLNRAAAEDWQRLALLSPATFSRINDSWAGRIWQVDAGWVPIGRVSGMDSLRKLWLVGMYINDADCAALAKLYRLTELNLRDNRIGDRGAESLAHLTALTALNLNHNQIGDHGAQSLTCLTALTALGLSDNGIGDCGAQSLAQLPALTTLNLSNNQIGDRGAEALARLPALTTLILHKNQLGKAGITAILDAWSDRPAHLPQPTKLALYSNPAENEDLPPELFANTFEAQPILAAWRRYRSTPDRPPLNEAKLLVVGNEAVGKTSLIRFLTTGTPRHPDEKKTPGAIIHERIETAAWHPADSPVTLNVWDFGGQEIMHGTHRFFLTERSLYLLLLEARREDSGRTIYDWLKTIRNHGKDSPVIVVINKCDTGADNLGLDETAIRRDFPQIVGFARTACNDDDLSRESIAALQHHIVETIHDDPRLKHVRDPMPRAWLRIKDALTRLAPGMKVIATNQYESLCIAGPPEQAVTDPHEQRFVMGLLHDLGVVIAHGWTRDGSTRMADITLLDPNWLTGAIYALLNSPTVRDQKGEFGWQQLPALLADPALYPAEHYGYIVDMMKDDDVAVCFELPRRGKQPRRFLIPEALPPSEPDYDGIWPDDSLLFRYDYGFLPPNLMPRFIVQAHRNLTDKRTCWRTGVVLEVEGCKVLVRANRGTRRVEIRVCGPASRRRMALAVIRNDLEAVHALNPEANPEAQVPLPDKPQCVMGYAHLLKLEAKYGPEREVDPVGADRAYTVGELLTSVRGRR